MQKEFNLQKIKQAQGKLAARFQNHPNIKLIDLGYDPKSMENIVIRIHLKSGANQKEKLATEFPEEIDGISVILIFADYGLE